MNFDKRCLSAVKSTVADCKGLQRLLSLRYLSSWFETTRSNFKLTYSCCMKNQFFLGKIAANLNIEGTLFLFK